VYPNLKILKLAHNQITCIASNDVTERISCTICGPEYKKAWHSDTLQELDLSHNKLTEFDLNLLNNAPNLTRTDFSHNEIRDVVVPKGIYHRQVCTVLLHHNQLGDAQKQLLYKNNSLYTKEYDNCIYRATIYGGVAGMLTGPFAVGTPIYIIYSVGVGLASGGLALGTTVGGLLIGRASARAIAHYCYPKNKRMYQPFALELEATEQDQNDEVVELENQ
jgi:hypothetical protein